MSLQIASLNSGSNGNCYYVGNEQEAVLIDVGISAREVVKRMKRIGLTIDKVKAVFITHEHGDHIAGVAKLSRKFKLPVYITPATLKNSMLALEPDLVMTFESYKSVVIGGLEVCAFPKYHDAIDPYSFIVFNQSVKVGVFTDIGYTCKHLIHHFQQCHAVFLESNYDVEMLMNGPYPPALKNRISAGQGHLSNIEALKLFLNHKPSFMSHLILSHLSRTNNKPELVEALFKPHANQTEIIIASRFRETEVFTIHGSSVLTAPNIKPIQLEQQLSLF